MPKVSTALKVESQGDIACGGCNEKRPPRPPCKVAEGWAQGGRWQCNPLQEAQRGREGSDGAQAVCHLAPLWWLSPLRDR